jgi:hypothetical protein
LAWTCADRARLRFLARCGCHLSRNEPRYRSRALRFIEPGLRYWSHVASWPITTFHQLRSLFAIEACCWLCPVASDPDATGRLPISSRSEGQRRPPGGQSHLSEPLQPDGIKHILHFEAQLHILGFSITAQPWAELQATIPQPPTTLAEKCGREMVGSHDQACKLQAANQPRLDQ